ncbi:MAG: hypothetical protein HY205_05415 [Nitrospirae bacterium]|nr:hypothetical protein [Nitrospirota bacterium]
MKQGRLGVGRRKLRGPSNPRRSVPRQTDPYTSQRAITGPAACDVCHAIFEKKRWRFDQTAYEDLMAAKRPKLTTCPACNKIRDRYPEGVLALRWPGLSEHRRDVLGLLRKEETRAKKVNPLGRIMKIEETGKEWLVFTTSTKLAQRLGRELERAYHGASHYHWAHHDKLVRVVWEREA